jgi:general secretion pathway protein D
MEPTQGFPMPAQRAGQAGGVGRSGSGVQGGAVSFNFDDADVYSVIQTVFGDLLRVNYIVDPRVKGRVTFRSVHPVSRENVLSVMEVILRLNGVGIVEEAGLFRIVPISDIAKEPAPISFGRDPEKIVTSGKSLLQVVPIKNVQSSEVAKLIAPFASASAVLIDVPRGNHIIIVDTDANVKRLLELVQLFDGDGFKRRRAGVYVYPVQNSKAKDVAALLQQIFLGRTFASTGTIPQSGLTGTSGLSSTQSYGTSGTSGATSFGPSGTSGLSSMQSSGTSGGTSGTTSAQSYGLSGTSGTAPSQTYGSSVSQSGASSIPPGAALVSEITRIFADETINSVVIVATPDDYEFIKEAIEKVDTQPRQVVIEGMVAQISLTDNLSLGVGWSLRAQMGLKAGIASNPDSLNAASSNLNALSGSGFSFVGIDDKGIVRATVTALATNNRAKLLAAPHILVADNRQARIQVGQQVPIVTAETFGTPGVAPQRVIQYRDIGIILKVRPQVNQSGLVALEISQEVSTFETIKLYSDSTEIILDKSEASTSLVVQDGQTIIIGGLIREDVKRSLTGVPFLSKIPLLGYLFGSRGADNSRQEILILLTPHVIKTQQEARDITSGYMDKFTEQGRVTREELGGVAPNRPSGSKTREVSPASPLPPPQEGKP